MNKWDGRFSSLAVLLIVLAVSLPAWALTKVSLKDDGLYSTGDANTYIKAVGAGWKVQGGYSLSYTDVGAANYTPVASRFGGTYSFNSTAFPRAMYMPDATTMLPGQRGDVLDKTQTAGSNVIRVYPYSTQKINNGTTGAPYTLSTNGERVNIVTDGANLFVTKEVP